MPRKWNIPLTYKPKINGVIDGTISQTIRAGRKFSVGDLVAFHGWEGTPYRSKWTNRTGYFQLNYVSNIWLRTDGIVWEHTSDELQSWYDCSGLAYLDGIEPPTGAALKKVLLGMHPLKKGETLEAQIIRWDYLTDLCNLMGGDAHGN